MSSWSLARGDVGRRHDADFYPFDMKFLGNVATRIINEVKGVNRVVYDVTSKPPGRLSGSEMATYLGFDGCRRGWVAAWIDDHRRQGFFFSPTIGPLLGFPHKRAMIDIPIDFQRLNIVDVTRRRARKLGRVFSLGFDAVS